MKSTLAITAAVVAIVGALAFSTLAVLMAKNGQQHGLDCAKTAQVCGR